MNTAYRNEINSVNDFFITCTSNDEYYKPSEEYIYKEYDNQTFEYEKKYVLYTLYIKYVLQEKLYLKYFTDCALHIQICICV